jgi:hypothetical protein
VTNALACRDQRESSRDGPRGFKCQLGHSLSVLRRQTRKLQAACGTGSRGSEHFEGSARRCVNFLACRDQRESSRDGSRGFKCQLGHSLSVSRRQTQKLQAACGTGSSGQRTSRGQPGAVSTLWPILINASRLEMTRVGSNASSDTRYPAHDGKRKSCRQAWETGSRLRALRVVSQAQCLDGCRYANPSAGLQAGHSGPRGRWRATADSPVPLRARLAGSHPLR